MKRSKHLINFQLPTFMDGFVSAFDITGQTMLDIPDFSEGFERDAKVLRGDWERIENDIRRAMGQVVIHGK